jgi:hypothetical protein
MPLLENVTRPLGLKSALKPTRVASYKQFVKYIRVEVIYFLFQQYRFQVSGVRCQGKEADDVNNCSEFGCCHLFLTPETKEIGLVKELN